MITTMSIGILSHNMRYALSLLFVTSFIVAAVFGFVLLKMNAGHMTNDCLATIVNGAICPISMTYLAMHHIAALKIFATAATPFLPLFSFLVLLFFSYIKNFFRLEFRFLPRCFRDSRFAFSSSQQRIISWLARFEHSPSA